MTNQITALDSGIQCMPNEEITVGSVHNLVQSSADILTELFGSLNAKPPDILESFDSLSKKSNKHHKKNKKHRHPSRKHKHKPKSKKSKRRKKISSVIPVPVGLGLPEICTPSTTLPNDISDMDSSSPTSVSSEDVSIDKKSRPRPIGLPFCAEDNVSIKNVDERNPFLNNRAEIEMIPQEIKLDIELDKISILGKFTHGLAINARSEMPVKPTVVQVIDESVDMETKPVEHLIIKESLNKRMALQNEKDSLTIDDKGGKRELGLELCQSVCKSEIVGLHSEVVLTPVISCERDRQIETENTQQTRQEVVNNMLKPCSSKSESRERSQSPTKKPKRSKECSPEKSVHKLSSKRLRDRNRSKSQDIDHLHKKKGSKAKDDSHNNKNRSRNQNVESKDLRQRSKGFGKNVYCDDKKKKRSSSRDRKGHVVSKKRQSRSCDESSHLEVNRTKKRERGKRSKSRSKSRDKRKRSISQDRSSDMKNTKRWQHRSVSKDKKILRKGRDRSRSRDRKQSISPDRSIKRKSRSRNRSVSLENKIENVNRERSTSKSKVQSRSISQDGESHTKILAEQIEVTEVEDPSRVKLSRSRSKDVSDNRSTVLFVDTVKSQDEHHNEDNLKTDSKVSLSKVSDSRLSKKKGKSKNVLYLNNSKTEKRHRSRSPVKGSRQHDRKRRSKSTDSSSPQKRSKRKSRSRSRSHNKDSKKTERRRQSNSKDGDNGRKDRRSRSKSRHSHKIDKTKKSKSKDREDLSKSKPRSKSKDTESHSASRKSRSRSRDKDKSSHRTDKRSRSRSPDRSRRSSARKRRSRSREVHIDKRKLFEIARKNAMTMLKQAAAPFGAENLVTIKAGGKSVEELTDFCKQLSKKEAGASSDSGEEDPDVHHSDSDVERPFHHPFQLKERPTNIVLNIRNSVSVPTKTFQEKTAEQSKQLRLQFPVSSGQNHRKTESEWVPVAPGQSSTSTQSSSNASQPSQPSSQSTSAAVSSPVLNATQTDSPSSSSVFPQAPASPPDIGNIVEKRVNAMRKLNANPNDSHAISQIYQVNQQMSMWLASKQQPGQFTGSTGAKVLTAAQLSTGYQAWAKKDQLMSAAPVSGGMGMALLQKMGWRPGEGLGKNKEGSLEPLKLEVKMDKKGLVAQEELSSKHQNSSRQHQRTTTLAGKHPVSLLVEFCSKRRWDSPQFHVCFECGPDHKKNFLFKVRVNGTEYQPSVASNNKKQAKAEAARLCLQTLGLLYPDPPK